MQYERAPDQRLALPPMNIAITTQVQEMPSEIPPSDFGFNIDYKKGSGPAKRVFGATHRFLEASEKCSAVLLDSIGITIEPVFVIEDITAGSLKTRFKIFWEEKGKEVVESGDVKKVVGLLISSAIELIMRRTNNKESQVELKPLRDDLYELANQGDVGRLRLVKSIPYSSLIEIIRDYESIKELLEEGDRAELVLPDNRRVAVDQSVVTDIGKLHEEATRETVIQPASTMILIVRKPDYLASSQWIFRHEGRNLPATIEDDAWIARFHNRDIDVRPGDALKCRVRVEVSYGYHSEVLSTKHSVEKIEAVLEKGIDPGNQKQLFPV